MFRMMRFRNDNGQWIERKQNGYCQHEPERWITEFLNNHAGKRKEPCAGERRETLARRQMQSFTPRRRDLGQRGQIRSDDKARQQGITLAQGRGLEYPD